MITPLFGRNLGLIRAGGAANAARHEDQTCSDGELAPRSPLSKNVEKLVRDAYRAGCEQGEAQHFRAGWRWGVLSGLLPGCVVGAASLLLLQLLGAA